MLEMLDQRNEIAVSADKHDSIQLGCELYRIHGDSDIPITLLGSSIEHLEVFRLDFISQTFQCLKKINFIFDVSLDDIGDGPDQMSPPDCFLEECFEIDLGFVYVSRRIIHILNVDENSDSLLLVKLRS